MTASPQPSFEPPWRPPRSATGLEGDDDPIKGLANWIANLTLKELARLSQELQRLGVRLT